MKRTAFLLGLLIVSMLLFGCINGKTEPKTATKTSELKITEKDIPTIEEPPSPEEIFNSTDSELIPPPE